MLIKKFEEIEAWKEARKLVKEIYVLTEESKLKNDFGLKDQLQRAAVSIMSNIAEGFDSRSNKSFIVFLRYSYRSGSEIQSLLYVLLDLQIINIEKQNDLYNKIEKIKKLIGGFIKSIK
ncbi:MAG: four helix bundle protein [Ignavibacteria bacterium CG2_30_36_16]|nr:four helix bundle protein [Ignavibacteria bacterium]OIP59354.1 MAG: four helix bundle protein [Ignavibacteria bacterium CG2_30_36_16]PJA99948.1 MAG: four helix bundle protein [Ignavibacteria bacterium CG_4_9_14_3_um_filter_36_18]